MAAAQRGPGMTGDLDHPTYPNPTVVEALCHVDFEPSQDASWQVSRPTPFLTTIEGEYPIVEPLPNPGITVTFDSLGGAPKVTPAPPNLKLSNNDKSRYIAVGDKFFAFGHLAR